MYRLSGQSRLQRKNECVIMQWLLLLMWRRLTFGEIVSESRFWHMVLDFMKEVLKMSTVITVLSLGVVIGFAVDAVMVAVVKAAHKTKNQHQCVNNRIVDLDKR